MSPRLFSQTASGEIPVALEILLQEILSNQRAQGRDIAEIKETLKEGSGEFRSIKEKMNAHDRFHRDQEASIKEEAKEMRRTVMEVVKPFTSHIVTIAGTSGIIWLAGHLK